ncbi:MAG: AAA family ATPase [Bacteroidetes bacterium]|nr:AAA family ATPase [Bacteroidota bacterium]
MKFDIESIKTLDDLRKAGWQSVSVKEEMRRNLIAKMQNDEPLFSGMVGYEKTVIPQIQNAILSRHDIILLGLRGQGKTRMLRMLVELLDPWMPVVEGSEINDDPYHPISRYARDIVAKYDGKTRISWVASKDRYAEKLATPDTTVADLVGDIDPIKAATQKLALSDEEVINFGLIPRTHRGIFAINELPDLQPRIQVALLNIMQERDIQIRGFNVRVPVDVCMVFSANPEDYTNRGNIITPLKDRIDSQIITHYPKTVDIGIQITGQEARIERGTSTKVHIPHYVREIIEQIAFEARESEYIDQKSGVSTRMTITAMENAVSAAERRALRNVESETTIRVCDIFYTVPSLTGKLELVYEGEQEGAVSVAQHLIGKAVSKVFKKYFPDPQRKSKPKVNPEDAPYKTVLDWFSSGNGISLPDDLKNADYRKRLMEVEGLEALVQKHAPTSDELQRLAMMDLVLEGLHQHSMLSKEDLDENRTYTDLVGSMLGSLGGFEDEDFQ